MSERLTQLIQQAVSSSSPQHLLVSRFLDSNGDGTGTKNANGNLAPDIFFIQPPAGQIYHIARLIVHIEDAGPLNADNYGGLAGALGNGITIRVQDDSGTIVDLTDGVPITSNAGWGRVCYDVDLDSFGAGADFLQIRWTFKRYGPYIRLNGDNNERLEASFNDNFTGLAAHYFMAQGYRVK